METLKQARLPIQSPADIVLARKIAKEWAVEATFSIVDQTKIVTATSELARNTLEYGGGGEMEISLLKREDFKAGLQFIFEDHGPGILDLNLALTDGYTSGKGLGMGLTGSKRLMTEFNIQTELGKGTRVTVTKWK